MCTWKVCDTGPCSWPSTPRTKFSSCRITFSPPTFLLEPCSFLFMSPIKLLSRGHETSSKQILFHFEQLSGMSKPMLMCERWSFFPLFDVTLSRETLSHCLLLSLTVSYSLSLSLSLSHYLFPTLSRERRTMMTRPIPCWMSKEMDPPQLKKKKEKKLKKQNIKQRNRIRRKWKRRNARCIWSD